MQTDKRRGQPRLSAVKDLLSDLIFSREEILRYAQDDTLGGAGCCPSLKKLSPQCLLVIVAAAVLVAEGGPALLPHPGNHQHAAHRVGPPPSQQGVEPQASQ